MNPDLLSFPVASSWWWIWGKRKPTSKVSFSKRVLNSSTIYGVLYFEGETQVLKCLLSLIIAPKVTQMVTEV